jgi:hypothetical protein
MKSGHIMVESTPLQRRQSIEQQESSQTDMRTTTLHELAKIGPDSRIAVRNGLSYKRNCHPRDVQGPQECQVSKISLAKCKSRSLPARSRVTPLVEFRRC